MDWDPRAYEADLMQGLSLSGEGPSYFARERVRHVAAQAEACGVRPRRVLEFGCGTGQNLPWLLDRFPASRLVGFEPSPALAGEARRRFAAEARVSSVERLRPDPPPRADLVFVNGVFHHIPPPDRPEALGAIRRSLAPGGLLALFENNPLNPGAMMVMRRVPFDRDAQPVRARTLLRLAGGAGLLDARVRTYFYFPRALRLLRPLEARLERLPLGAQYALYARG